MTNHDAWHSLITSAGSQFGDWFGRSAALHYGDAAAEYQALSEGVGLVDASSRSLVAVSGADRASFLHNLCTNEIRKLPAGAGAEAFLLDARGHIVFHTLILAGNDEHILDAGPGQGEQLLRHLDKYLIRERVELLDRSHDWGELLVAGPQAVPLLAKLVGDEFPAERLAHLPTYLGGRNVTIVQVDLARPISFLVRATKDDLPIVWSELVQAGARPCGEQAFDAARIEAGHPFFGRDISDKNLPQEVGRDQQTISFVKGCYLGQETVARIDALGHVNKTLVGVHFQGEQVPQPGLAIASSDGQPVGEVTSAAWSGRLKSPLALAYIRRGHTAPGTHLKSELGEAKVIALPA
jgi:folate-binding protein YgfZ